MDAVSHAFAGQAVVKQLSRHLSVPAPPKTPPNALRQVAGSTTPRSPFAAAAAAPAVTPGRIVPSTAPKAPGGLLSRLCSCGRPAADGGGDEGHEEGGSGRGGREAAAAHAASASPASPTPAHSVSVRAGPFVLCKEACIWVWR